MDTHIVSFPSMGLLKDEDLDEMALVARKSSQRTLEPLLRADIERGYIKFPQADFIQLVQVRRPFNSSKFKCHHKPHYLHLEELQQFEPNIIRTVCPLNIKTAKTNSPV